MIINNKLPQYKKDNYNCYLPYTIEEEGSTGTVGSVGSLLIKSSYFNALAYNNQIYVIGGGSDSKTCCSWDGVNWNNVPSLQYESRFKGATVYNNEIHLIGTDDNRHVKYSATNPSWEYIGITPVSHAYNDTTVTFNDEIHVIGLKNSIPYDGHYKFDGMVWSSVGTTPYQCGYTEARVYNSAIHIVGGSWNGGITNTAVDHWSYKDGTWTQELPAPYPHIQASLVVHDGLLHLSGGRGIDNVKLNYHYVYDGETWTQLDNIPVAVTAHETVSYKGGLYLLGGEGDEYGFYCLALSEGEKSYNIVCRNNEILYTESQFTKTGDTYKIDLSYSDEGEVIEPIVYVYNKNNTKLLYTNQQIKYNTDISKYELYGYFPTTVTNLNTTISTEGWQTLELSTPVLFK